MSARVSIVALRLVLQLIHVSLSVIYRIYPKYCDTQVITILVLKL